MKNLTLYIALLICSFTQAQNIALIERMQGSSLDDSRTLASNLINTNSAKYELIKEKSAKDGFLLFYLPTGMTKEQKEEAAVNAYNDGIIVRLSKLENGNYKLREFKAEPQLMFAIVKNVFYPEVQYNDFVTNTKFRDFLNADKKYKFYFYSGESPNSKYRFYSF